MKLKYLFKRRQFIQHPQNEYKHDLFITINEYNSIIDSAFQNAKYMRLMKQKNSLSYTKSLISRRNVIKDLLMPLTEIYN